LIFCVQWQVGSHFGWRYAFWIEAILMLPFAILGFLMKPLHLKGTHFYGIGL
jgi:predicted MFS family arabinose efflux permease